MLSNGKAREAYGKGKILLGSKELATGFTRTTWNPQSSEVHE